MYVKIDYSHTRIDKIKNDQIRWKIQVANIEDKVREGRLRWFAHILHRLSDAPGHVCETIMNGSVKKKAR